MTFAKPKGTEDAYGSAMLTWRYIEDSIRRFCGLYGIGEIRTPMYEYVDLFRRGVGETTDIVQREMFTFQDAGGREYALRPEGTAGVVRAFTENGLWQLPTPLKFFYIMPNFRAEKPQKGRLRQHHQFGVEYLGAAGPGADAELISVAYRLIEGLGIKNMELRINSLGCKDCRSRYNGLLTDFLRESLDKLCPTCRERFGRNPLRVLDCKNETCKALVANAPTSLSALDDECRAHFEGVKASLTNLGIGYVVNESLVRGLDYYTRTVFEIVSNDLGAQNALCGGGRYDNLVEDTGGPATPAVGFGMGIERLVIALQEGNLAACGKPQPVFLGHTDEDGRKAAEKAVSSLRAGGIPAEGDLLNRSVKAQMKYADKIGAGWAVIIGPEEIASGNASIKDMTTGEAETRPLSELVQYFRNMEAR